MKQYQYQYIDPGSVKVEDGTQQSFAVIHLLNERGQQGWHVQSREGDLDGDFSILLEREQDTRNG